MREETQSIPLTGEIISEQYQVNCKLCGNQEVTENPDNWKCICQNPPKGLSSFHICSNHNHRYWGSANAECIKCIQDRANGIAKNLTNIHVDYGLIGDWPKTNLLEREGLAREKAFDLEQKRIEFEQRYKKAQIDSAFALAELPKLIKETNDKLDKLLQIHGDGLDVN